MFQNMTKAKLSKMWKYMLVCVFVSDWFPCVDLEGGGGCRGTCPALIITSKLLYVSLEILLRKDPSCPTAT